MTADHTFVDTNVLVYAYDADAGDKHATARGLMSQLWNERSGVTSIQVLQEFYVNATRKIPKPLSRRTAREVVATYAAWGPHRPRVDDMVAASRLEEQHHLSFWDALIVVSAQQMESSTLLSEDLQDGRQFGSVRVHNPFAGPRPPLLEVTS